MAKKKATPKVASVVSDESGEDFDLDAAMGSAGEAEVSTSADVAKAKAPSVLEGSVTLIAVQCIYNGPKNVIDPGRTFTVEGAKGGPEGKPTTAREEADRLIRLGVARSV